MSYPQQIHPQPVDITGGQPMFDVVQLENGTRLKTDPSRDDLLTDFGKATLNDRYLLPGETYQDLFARVAVHYSDDSAHAQRLRLYFQALVHAVDAGSVERRHQPRPADLLLPQ